MQLFKKSSYTKRVSVHTNGLGSQVIVYPVAAYIGLLLKNKNLAIANRSHVSCINTNNNTMTLKSGIEVIQGH